MKLHTVVPIPSVAMFEKIPLIQVLVQTAMQPEAPHAAKQLQVFTF